MKDIEDYRRKNFPLIYMFHLYLDKSEYKIEDLKLTVKQYNFYKNSKIFKKKLMKILKICFFFKKKDFIKFLIIQEIFFKKYYNTFSSVFFEQQNNLNTLELNYVFNIFLLKAKYRFVIYDLNNWYDWYSYAFNEKIIRYYKITPPNIYFKKRQNKERVFKLQKLILLVYNYKVRYKKILKIMGKNFVNMVMFRHSFANFFKIRMNYDFSRYIKNFYSAKFSESSISKYINANTIKKYNFFFLRKNRIFNKGRYSRNRQLYRTGVYWCL